MSHHVVSVFRNDEWEAGEQDNWQLPSSLKHGNLSHCYLSSHDVNKPKCPEWQCKKQPTWCHTVFTSYLHLNFIICLPLMMYSQRTNRFISNNKHSSPCLALYHHRCHLSASPYTSIFTGISHYAELYVCAVLFKCTCQTKKGLYSTSLTLRYKSTTWGLRRLNSRLVFSCRTPVTIKTSAKQAVWQDLGRKEGK